MANTIKPSAKPKRLSAANTNTMQRQTVLSSLLRTSRHASRPELSKEVPLPHKPGIPSLPIFAIELDLEIPQESRNQLIDLQQTDVLADTRARAGSELEHSRLHVLELRGGRVDPALRDKRVDVRAEDLGPPVQDPRIAAYDHAARDVLAADGDAGRGRDALEDQTRSRVHAEGLLDHGVEVWEFLRFGP